MWVKGKKLVLLYSAIVLTVSYFTYFQGYAKPAALFWDENYHIPAAEKYLNKVFFMEYHPPLGKLFIALGEYLLHPNEGKNVTPMLSTSYIKEVPAGFSFQGVRLFPTIFGWLGALVFFLLLYSLTANPHTALLFSSLYLFENSMIVHFRGAMLDGMQIFFILLVLYYFVHLCKQKRSLTNSNFFWLGVLIGLGLAVKLTALLLVILFPFLVVRKMENLKEWLQVSFYKKTFIGGLIFTLGIILPFLLVWYVHFAIGNHVVANQWYGASDQLKKVVSVKQQASPQNFILHLQDTYKFFVKNNRGVPKLDLCKPGENGSYPLSWVIGSKSINYRWEKTKDQKVMYLYLQSNPVIILFCFIGIGLSLVLVLSRLFFDHPIRNQEIYFFILALTSFYLVYMGLMIKIERVMYFYHYFIPYVVSMVLIYLLFNYAFEELIHKANCVFMGALGLCLLEIIVVFLYYSPLTYYQPIAAQQVNSRAWIKSWQLKAIN